MQLCPERFPCAITPLHSCGSISPIPSRIGKRSRYGIRCRKSRRRRRDDNWILAMGFNYRILKPTDPYYAHWKNLKSGGRFGCLILIGLFFLCFLSALPVRLLLGWEFPWNMAPGLVLFWIVWTYSLHWPCPRCGRPFRCKFLYHPPAPDNCLHCGLPKYAPNGEDY